jgi:hypothetical protein
MSWEDIMRRVLPPIGGVSPHITSRFGEQEGRPPGSSKPHRAVDFNYMGGRYARLNLGNPTLYSPVAGTVTKAGQDKYGTIAIRDANGVSHEILHTHSQHVKRGNLVGVGQPIGRMGNTGTKDHHVHYQLKDTADQIINPTDFWDRLGSVKTDPGQPAYFEKYQQYLRGLGADASAAFRNALGTASMPAPGSFAAPSDSSPPLYAKQTERRLGRRIAGKPESIFDTGAPAVQFVPPNDVLSPDRQNSVDNRFGNWTSVPVAPPNAAQSADRQNSFADRFGNWTSSPEGGISPRNPNLPLPPPVPGRPLGGLLNNTDASGNNDWFNLMAGLVSQHPTPPGPSPQTSVPERRLGRRIVNLSPASVFDTGAPGVPFVPSEAPDFSGGLLGRFAALAGIRSRRRMTSRSKPICKRSKTGSQARAISTMGGSCTRPA